MILKEIGRKIAQAFRLAKAADEKVTSSIATSLDTIAEQAKEYEKTLRARTTGAGSDAGSSRAGWRRCGSDRKCASGICRCASSAGAGEPPGEQLEKNAWITNAKKREKKIMGLLEMIREFNELLDEKDGLKEATKRNNEAISAKTKEIAEQMIDDDVPSISVGGYKFFLQNKTMYSKKSEEALMEAGLDFLVVLREQGLGDIIQETVNSRTLQSTIKNLVEETGSLPEELAEVLSVYDTYEISRRKETNKTANKVKKAKKGN